LVETVARAARDLLKKLEDRTPPRKTAPRLLSMFIPAMEGLAVSRSAQDRIRASLVKLVKISRGRRQQKRESA
jgi:hypothetical protein